MKNWGSFILSLVVLVLGCLTAVPAEARKNIGNGVWCEYITWDGVGNLTYHGCFTFDGMFLGTIPGGGGGGSSGGGGNSGGGSNNDGDGTSYDGIEDILPERLSCLIGKYHPPGYGPNPNFPVKKKLSWAYNSGQGTPIHQYSVEQDPPPTAWNRIVRGRTDYSKHVSYLFYRAFKPLVGNINGDLFGNDMYTNSSGNMTAEEAALFTALHEIGHQHGLTAESAANYVGNFGVNDYRLGDKGSACD